ncbi:hypothetical protein [Nigerium massiliense]|uniref:hypothetical protein n=1 Tax=Nigerium massiliense TaxID=1522317 RepID=UPI0036F41A2F
MRFDAPRSLIRGAIALLEARFVVRRVQGSGTYVTDGSTTSSPRTNRRRSSRPSGTPAGRRRRSWSAAPARRLRARHGII